MPITSGILVPDSQSQLFTAPSALVLRFACFTNISDNEVELTLWLVKDGEAPSDANTLFAEIKLLPKESFVLDSDRLILDQNDSIFGRASAPNAVSFVASYYPLT